MVGIFSQCMPISNHHFQYQFYNFICTIQFCQLSWKNTLKKRVAIHQNDGAYLVPAFLLPVGCNFSLLEAQNSLDVVSSLTSYTRYVSFSSIRLNSLNFCECAKWSRFSSVPARSLILVMFFFTQGRKDVCLNPHLTWPGDTAHGSVLHACVCGIEVANVSLIG